MRYSPQNLLDPPQCKCDLISNIFSYQKIPIGLILTPAYSDKVTILLSIFGSIPIFIHPGVSEGLWVE